MNPISPKVSNGISAGSGAGLGVALVMRYINQHWGPLDPETATLLTAFIVVMASGIGGYMTKLETLIPTPDAVANAVRDALIKAGVSPALVTTTVTKTEEAQADGFGGPAQPTTTHTTTTTVPAASEASSTPAGEAPGPR